MFSANHPWMKFVPALALAWFCAAVSAGAQTLPANYRVTNSLPYVTGGLSRQWMDLYYVPSNAAPSGTRLYIRGGNYQENLIFTTPMTIRRYDYYDADGSVLIQR